MEIEKIEMEERRGKFILKNSSPAMANALRRTMLSDIPKMAIDKVEFHLGPIMSGDREYESVTPLFDEIVAHRLGMVPVPTDHELFTFKDQCSCGGEGCPSCTLMYSLNKIGPCTILSGDMIPLGNPDLGVKDEFIPVVEITDGQAVLIYATAVMGTAKEHVKWQATFGVGYKYLPVITVDSAKASTPEALECVKLCPKGVFEEKSGKLKVKDGMKCVFCGT
ncbi:MAG: DNA-directed RNA polymerase subunit D, partial [Candidatus Methanoplasma sp.]|nr:DNA-directed RNA polymerase subunit D [Candidatus Methanoplasma sp.]